MESDISFISDSSYFSPARCFTEEIGESESSVAVAVQLTPGLETNQKTMKENCMQGEGAKESNLCIEYII